jgi:peptidyl-prolyl cis-trans isomerase C
MLVVTILFFIAGGIAGCGTKEDKAKVAKPVMASAATETAAETAAAPPAAEPAAPPAAKPGEKAAPPAAGKADGGAGTAVEVDGVKMTKAELEAETKKRLETVKDQVPADKVEQAKAEIRKSLVDDFVVRTVMTREVAAQKVTASEKEITEILNGMKDQLPPGMTMDDFMKKNKIDSAKIREEIGLNIKINKLVEKAAGKVKPSDKEVSGFYEKNKDKFQQPESVHARHILVAKAPEDKEKELAAKKAKAEELRKKLVGGADFADLAAKNSDCPSKQAGGDLGTFARGQMIKPFEDAAFSQEKNAIGPVVETDFGFHIIQVLDHQAAQVLKLDGEMKKKISGYLEGQKRQAAFDDLVKRLKGAANIVVYGK